MRIVWVVPLALLAAFLLAIQFVAGIALRSDAQTGSWVRLVPEPLALRIEQLDPRLPLPPALRLVLARRALERDDLEVAQAYIEGLPQSPDRLALAGRLAERRGDGAASLRAYLAADDLDDVERQVDALAAQQRFDRALVLQNAIVARLRTDPTQTDALAQAYYELGQLDEARSWRLRILSPPRYDAEAQAAAAYAEAVALAPLSERYLIAYGNQLLNVKRGAEAERTFARAYDIDPASPEPLVGLGEAAFRRGNVATARSYLERARKAGPQDAAVARLARELGV